MKGNKISVLQFADYGAVYINDDLCVQYEGKKPGPEEELEIRGLSQNKSRVIHLFTKYRLVSPTWPFSSVLGEALYHIRETIDYYEEMKEGEKINE